MLNTNILTALASKLESNCFIYMMVLARKFIQYLGKIFEKGLTKKICTLLLVIFGQYYRYVVVQSQKIFKQFLNIMLIIPHSVYLIFYLL